MKVWKAIFKLAFGGIGSAFWFGQDEYGHLVPIEEPSAPLTGGVNLFSFRFNDLEGVTAELNMFRDRELNTARSIYFLSNLARTYPYLERGAVTVAYETIEEHWHLNDCEINIIKKLLSDYMPELVIESYLGVWHFDEGGIEKSNIARIMGFRRRDDYEKFVSDFFSDDFSRMRTRVVGFRYRKHSFMSQNGEFELSIGAPVYLHRDYSNPHDNYAVAVLYENGEMLGWLRRTIAYHIGYLIDKGMLLKGRIAAVLPNALKDDEKVYIEISRMA